MLTMRENIEAILKGEQPDYYIDCMDAMVICPDPVFLADIVPKDGEMHKDSWGVWKSQGPEEVGATPRNDKYELKVVKDIEDWRESLVVPPTKDLDWSLAEGFASKVNRNEKYVCFFSAGGLFERSHFLMGMEDAFCAYLEEPEEMYEMLKVIKDFKIDAIWEAKKHVNPDAIFFQDDWGSKQNLFLPPDTWREIIKPLQQEISDAIHECGMLYIHHSDCYCAPIARDMVELGIDIWQGVIPENPIEEIQKDTRENCDHQLCMQGGIDTPRVDIEGLSEDYVRQCVREDLDRCLPGGYFFIGCTGGGAFNQPNDTWLQDERIRYARQWALDHPVGPLASDDFDLDTMVSWYQEERALLPSDNAE